MTIRVAIVGVGNCANSLLQGLHYYRGVNGLDPVMGLVRPALGGYHVADIEAVAAFDVTDGKVGRDLSEAMWAFPNATFKFADVSPAGVVVDRGPTLDGRGKYMQDWGQESGEPAIDVAKKLRDVDCDVVINYLPVGSEQAAKFYAQAALDAGCAFINCIPVFLASDPVWEGKFKEKGLPIIGDDIKSQVGATLTHRVLAHMMADRGVALEHTYQLNVGGNGDFKNMLERERLESKKKSKTEAVVSVMGVDLKGRDVHIGPSDYVEWLGDKKIAFIRLEGRGFGGAPMHMEIRLEVWDSPNSAGIVIDAIRCAQLARDRGLSGAIKAPSAYFMKRPPEQVEDSKGLTQLEAWIGANMLGVVGGR
jgi:myo-inositol-1-phosphate synthase